MTRNRLSRDLSSFLRKNTSFQFLAISVILFGLNSCYNEPNMVGGGLIPGEDTASICITDTFKIEAYTAKTDSFSTSYFKYAVLGCNKSDIYGKVKADFLTSFKLANSADTFQKLPSRPMDSVFLELRLNKTWGQKNKSINIRVFQLTKDIYSSTSTKTYINGFKDISSDKYSPVEVGLPAVYSGEDSIRIRLTDDFVSYLKGLPDSAFIDNEVLQREFKGFYVTSDDYNSNDGVLYFFQSTGYSLGIVIHHKRQTIRNGVSMYIDTVLNLVSSSTPRYTHLYHDYSSAAPALKINHFYDFATNATNVEDSVFYIDGLGGVKGLIKFKSAEYWKKLMPIAIHRAELRLDAQFIEPYFPYDSLINPLFYYLKRNYDPDYGMLSDDFTNLSDYSINNKVNTVSYNRAKEYYSIDVKLHLQNVLKGKVKEDYFFIEPTDFKYYYKQGIFRTGKNSKPIKLIVTYSKL